MLKGFLNKTADHRLFFKEFKINLPNRNVNGLCRRLQSLPVKFHPNRCQTLKKFLKIGLVSLAPFTGNLLHRGNSIPKVVIVLRRFLHVSHYESFQCGFCGICHLKQRWKVLYRIRTEYLFNQLQNFTNDGKVARLDHHYF